MTRAMIFALTGICVEDGLLDWTTPVHQILPELVNAFDGLGAPLTVLDLLSHRSGIARGDALWLQCAGNNLLDKSKGIQT